MSNLFTERVLNMTAATATAGGLHRRGRAALLRQVSHSERSLLPGKASRPVWA